VNEFHDQTNQKFSIISKSASNLEDPTLKCMHRVNGERDSLGL
jgi:hypothetical protein